MSVAAWGERRQPAYGRSFALAFLIHAALIAVLFFGVRFQSHKPEAVTVELWEPPSPPPRVAEPPKPEPKVEPEPPKPEPKIEKPEIVEKPAPKPKPKPKPEPKPQPEPKPKPKPEPVKPKPAPRDLELEKLMREQIAREQSTIREQQIRDQAVREGVAREQAARSKALAGWLDKIRLKIKGNIPSQVLQEVTGNPEAIFDVALLPTGEVLTVRMRKSSGHKGYDEAVERAILKSSPLPKPDQPGLFERQLELRFRPLDK